NNNIIDLIKRVQDILVSIAEQHIQTIMPGYTHTQRAQPVLLSHHLLAYYQMFNRDISRLTDSLKRINVMPLGSCALAGTTLNIDRHYTAELLGFDSVSPNSMDSVSDRDFIIEFMAISSILMMHISRLAEELILWSTTEFSFIEISDSFTTGSSIMPQKKNPDVAEIMRGKTGRIYGNLISLLTTMKGLPLTYNRDMQEDKEPLFDTVDTIKLTLQCLIEMLPEIRFNKERMLQTSSEGFANATDMAEYLVSKGVPFRNAHEIVGGIVKYCISHNKELQDLTIDELRSFSALFSDDVFECLIPLKSVNNRRSYGSASTMSVIEQLKDIKKNEGR
ncbi:MAG: argininosuccinate lyase, partial [Thermodesulfovibrionales bacterium]